MCQAQLAPAYFLDCPALLEHQRRERLRVYDANSCEYRRKQAQGDQWLDGCTGCHEDGLVSALIGSVSAHCLTSLYLSFILRILKVSQSSTHLKR